jgi:ATPase subunit of ABC transporter with duplicated ATPase domains
MISIAGLSKHYGGQTLFDDVSLQLNAGERYGIVGANGAGKSTFARVLAGEEAASGGEIHIPKRARLGFLKQDRFESEEQRIIDVAMMGHRELWLAMSEKAALIDKGPVGEAEGHRLGELEEIIGGNGGYELESRAAEVLCGLGIPTAQHEGPLRILSGGFKLRALLAQTLAASPDVLVLDEPTNHLDIISIAWLERFLLGYAGCAIIVSHDRHFLDTVSTYIADVDYETITLYKGGYERFVEQKVAERERREKEIEKRKAEVAEKKAFVDRFRAQATKARQAQSRIKQIDRIVIDVLAESSRQAPLFRFPQQRPSGKEVLDVKAVSKAYGDKRVLEDVSLLVRRGERVAVIGENGIGKSTLLKVAVGEVKPDTGEAAWGYETHLGYFPQDHGQVLGAHGTVASWLQGELHDEGTGAIRSRLGRVLFSGDDADKPLTALSGGEAARLLFARIEAVQPNVLILDEPTNHLDIESIEALVEALQSYEGTLLFVSHDRWFVERLATRVVELRRCGMSDYAGTYAEYLSHQGADHLDREAVNLRARAEAKGGDKGGKRPRGGDTRRQKKLEQQRDAAWDALCKAEEELKAIEEAFCRAGYFESTPADEVAQKQARQAALQGQIEELMAKWERLEAELTEAAA